MQRTISTIIPTYNGAEYIEQAIDSALAQTYPTHEIILVDDGSTDDTAVRVSHYGKQIKYIRQQNKGTAGAYNTGIAAASGDYVAFLEQDDIWTSAKSAYQVEAFDRNIDLGMVFSPVRILKEEIASKQSDIDQQSGEGKYSFEDFFVRNRVLNCSTVMIRRDILKQVGGFREDLKLAFDYDLWLRIALKSGILCLDTPLATYRIHGNNQSKDDHDLLAAECSLEILQSLVDKPGLSEKIGRPVVRDRISRLHRDVAWEHARLGHRDEELQHLLASARVSPLKLRNWREYLWRRISRQTRNRMVWYIQRIQSALGWAPTSGTHK